MNPLPPDQANFELPVFDEKPREQRQLLSWETVMRETKVFRDYYRKHYDSPERRLAQKNPEPFRLARLCD